MTFEEFEGAARQMWARVPRAYLQGIDGLTAVREARRHPTLPEIYTLGECLTEEYPSEWSGPETTRSRVVLYYGSFRRLSELDPDFSWEDELWETLTHELRHHLESLASQDALEELDYAADESFKRFEGAPFDPLYYRSGEAVAPALWRVEGDFYLEQSWWESDFERAQAIEFDWRGARYRIPRPERLGDVHFVLVDGMETDDGVLELVLVRRRPWRESLRRLLRGGEPEVLESEAEPAAEDGDGG
ncbi:MAG: metallopeptidase family protein [Gemmatimonadetes bacterium]|nr:metallopeptidase family protein [Gemmatimonadota bacterium]